MAEADLHILITPDEADEMTVLAGQLDESEAGAFEWVVETVLGELVRRRSDRFQNVGFIVTAIPDAIGEDGEMICRVMM